MYRTQPSGSPSSAWSTISSFVTLTVGNLAQRAHELTGNAAVEQMTTAEIRRLLIDGERRASRPVASAHEEWCDQ